MFGTLLNISFGLKEAAESNPEPDATAVDEEGVVGYGLGLCNLSLLL